MNRLLQGHQVGVRFQNWLHFNARFLHFLHHVGRQHQVACSFFRRLLCLPLPVKSEVGPKIGEAPFLLDFHQEVFVQLEERLELLWLQDFVRESAVLAFLTELGCMEEFARQLGQIVRKLTLLPSLTGVGQVELANLFL